MRCVLRLADLPPVQLANRPQDFPDGWVLPSRGDLIQAINSRARGLVPTHKVPKNPAELIPPEDIRYGRVERVAHSLAQTLYGERADGRGIVGLAAPQKGIRAPIIVADLQKKYPQLEFEGLSCLVDGEIVEEGGGSEVRMEMCFSTGGAVAPVENALYVVVRGYNLQGQPFEGEFSGYDTRILRHELDHPKAVLMTQRAREQGYELNWAYAEHHSLAVAHHRAAYEQGLHLGFIERWPPHYPYEQFEAYYAGRLAMDRFVLPGGL